MSERTSKSVAAIAARGIKNPGSLSMAEIKKVCASCLTQRDRLVAAIKALRK